MIALDWADVIRNATLLFFIMDPLGNIPLFNSLLKNYSLAQRTRIIIRELVFALVILLLFLWLGASVLHYLGLSEPTLSIAGGVLLFIISLRMIFPEHNAVAESVADPFIVPIAIPLIAGPSTLTVLLLMGSDSSSGGESVGLLAQTLALLIAWLANACLLVPSPKISAFIGQRGLLALERLMGMLLVLLAVQMFLNGVNQYLNN